MSGAISEMRITHVRAILAAGWIVFVTGGPLGRFESCTNVTS